MGRPSTSLIPAAMTDCTAWFDNFDRTDYRFWLSRHLGGTRRPRRLLAIMMNPSVAGYERNDPTTTVMMGFARRWGFGWYGAVNMDPTIEPDSTKLVHVPDDVWAMNLQAIRQGLAWVDAVPDSAVITAWGAHDWKDERLGEVVDLLRDRPLLRFGANKDGSPRFPRAIRKDTIPKVWFVGDVLNKPKRRKRKESR